MDEDPSYGNNLCNKYLKMQLEMERIKRELWYVSHIDQLEKDVGECSFAKKKIL